MAHLFLQLRVAAFVGRFSFFDPVSFPWFEMIGHTGVRDFRGQLIGPKLSKTPVQDVTIEQNQVLSLPHVWSPMKNAGFHDFRWCIYTHLALYVNSQSSINKIKDLYTSPIVAVYIILRCRFIELAIYENWSVGSLYD